MEAQTSWERGMERIRHGEEVWRGTQDRDGTDLFVDVATIWASLFSKAREADRLAHPAIAADVREARKYLRSAWRALAQHYPVKPKKPREGSAKDG